MDSIRVAVVGFGGYGRWLVQATAEHEERVGCRLVGAADARLADLADKADALRDRGVELFDDALAMYDALAGRCEAVYVATGIPSHEPLAVAALEHGYHVLLEKPPAPTVQEVNAMQAAADRAGRLVAVGFQQVYAEDTWWLAERLAAGALGRVERISCHASWPRQAGYFGRTDWAGQARMADRWVLDGPAMNALAHQVNNMLLLAGAATSGTAGAYATPTRVRGELYAAGPVRSHDTAAIEIETAGGPPLFFLASHCGADRFGPFIVVQGERGRATWCVSQQVLIEYADGAREGFGDGGGDGGDRVRMAASFARAVAANDPAELRCPLSAARNMVLALDGAHESSGQLHRIGPDHARHVHAGRPDARSIVAGLDELLVRCALRGRLFSDAVLPPAWAVATQAFDLQDYAQFPQRFRVE